LLCWADQNFPQHYFLKNSTYFGLLLLNSIFLCAGYFGGYRLDTALWSAILCCESFYFFRYCSKKEYDAKDYRKHLVDNEIELTASLLSGSEHVNYEEVGNDLVSQAAIISANRVDGLATCCTSFSNELRITARVLILGLLMLMQIGCWIQTIGDDCMHTVSISLILVMFVNASLIHVQSID
jgi:hypothetical protein